MTKKKPPRYGLIKLATKKAAREFLDMDYIDKLSEAEKDWLDKYCREVYQNTFRNNDTDFYPEKTAERRACYNAENARNRDVWTQLERDDKPISTRPEDEEES